MVVMNGIQRRRNCYHESGHAVAWVMNGDGVLLVVADRNASMREDQKELWMEGQEARGRVCGKANAQARECTVASVSDHRCTCCEGTIKPDLCNPLVAKFHLSVECPGCLELLINHIACMFAGWAATSSLKNGASAVDVANSVLLGRSEMRDDRRDVDRIVKKLPFNSEDQRNKLREMAQSRAVEWIEQESKAVSALASVLLQVGVVDGEEAERIIKENLIRIPRG